MARIAVVNDDTMFLSMMCDLLAEEGWESYSLREADSAFEELRQDPPDLIILDIRLGAPEAGWTVLNLLKLDRATANVPIVVCSAALQDLRAKESYLNDRGVGILVKPFDIDDLYTCVRTTLETGKPWRIGLGES
jgi:DNA-binding response OmpR family regulator